MNSPRKIDYPTCYVSYNVLNPLINRRNQKRLLAVYMSYTRVLAFNNLLRDIINQVSDKFPGDQDIEYTRSKIELSTSLSPHMVITAFMRNVEPYAEKIKKKDERFFLNMASGKEQGLDGLQLGDKWHKFDESEKEIMWKNMQKLVKLGDRILSE